MIRGKMFINGEWTDAKNGRVREIINPFNQEVIATVPEGSAEDSHAAIAAARAAFDEGVWSAASASERGERVRLIGQKIANQNEEFARLESLDTGKTLEESRTDMEDIANVFFILLVWRTKMEARSFGARFRTQQASLSVNL